MISSEKVLDYDKLVEAYSSNLDITLRGFRPAEEMLDTWVPDDDPIRGLSSLAEAAQLSGSESVSVRVSKKTLENHAMALLKEKLESLGEVSCLDEQESVVFTISKLQETASFRSVRSIYQSALRNRAANLKNARSLEVHGEQIPLRTGEGQYSMAWAVRTEQHIITDAVFDGAKHGPMAAALDLLCEIVIGLPIQEARDHAVIRLEFALRDKNRPHAISGIVLPINADPIFRVPAALAKRLFDDYCTSTRYQPAMNFFDAGPRKEWSALSPSEREQKVAAVLVAHGPSMGFVNGDVQVVECKYPYAVTVRFGDSVPLRSKRVIALGLERVVRQQCDPRLEVFCEEKKDLSKLRRLTN